MGFELIAILLSIVLFAIPLLAWVLLRRISAADKMQKNTEEMRSLENSLSLMIKELQDSVQKALADMEEAADSLGKTIDKADDRLRQLEYYYEYGDELKPLVQSQPQQQEPSMPEQPSVNVQASAPHSGHMLKHKEVHELSRKGWSAAQIAKHTGMSTDEVQLIVNLMEISTLSNMMGPQKEPLHQKQTII